jgi:pimeloyl-ACP methyl ester carboxylesterase
LSAGVSSAEATLYTVDGEAISAVHTPGDHRDLAIVVVHGFTGHWREERVQKVIRRLVRYGGVVAIDMRGHGRSTGTTSLGDTEVLDVLEGVEWARRLGYSRVVTVGFSLGGAVVLREAGLAAAGRLAGTGPGAGRVDAVVSVSAPAFWFYKGTRVTRVVHRLVETRPGRLAMRARGTRITSQAWRHPYPLTPREAVALLGSTPLLVVHGDVDRYFPVEHPQAIHASAAAAGVPAELWLERGLGHAETAISDAQLDRIGEWARLRGMDSGATRLPTA